MLNTNITLISWVFKSLKFYIFHIVVNVTVVDEALYAEVFTDLFNVPEPTLITVL